MKMLLIIGLGTVACVYAQVNGPYPVPPQANGAYPVPYPVPIHANGPRPVPYPVPPKANGAYPVPYPVPPMTNNLPTASMDLDNPSDGIGADYSDDEVGGDYIRTPMRWWKAFWQRNNSKKCARCPVVSDPHWVDR